MMVTSNFCGVVLFVLLVLSLCVRLLLLWSQHSSVTQEISSSIVISSTVNGFKECNECINYEVLSFSDFLISFFWEESVWFCTTSKVIYYFFINIVVCICIVLVFDVEVEWMVEVFSFTSLVYIFWNNREFVKKYLWSSKWVCLVLLSLVYMIKVGCFPFSWFNSLVILGLSIGLSVIVCFLFEKMMCYSLFQTIIPFSWVSSAFSLVESSSGSFDKVIGYLEKYFMCNLDSEDIWSSGSGVWSVCLFVYIGGVLVVLFELYYSLIVLGVVSIGYNFICSSFAYGIWVFIYWALKYHWYVLLTLVVLLTIYGVYELAFKEYSVNYESCLEEISYWMYWEDNVNSNPESYKESFVKINCETCKKGCGSNIFSSGFNNFVCKCCNFNFFSSNISADSVCKFFNACAYLFGWMGPFALGPWAGILFWILWLMKFIGLFNVMMKAAELAPVPFDVDYNCNILLFWFYIFGVLGIGTIKYTYKIFYESVVPEASWLVNFIGETLNLSDLGLDSDSSSSKLFGVSYSKDGRNKYYGNSFFILVVVFFIGTGLAIVVSFIVVSFIVSWVLFNYLLWMFVSELIISTLPTILIKYSQSEIISSLIFFIVIVGVHSFLVFGQFYYLVICNIVWIFYPYSYSGELIHLKKGELVPLKKGELVPLNKGEVIPNEGELVPLGKTGELVPLKTGELVPLNKGELVPLNKGELVPLNKGELVPLKNGEIVNSTDKEVIIIIVSNGSYCFKYYFLVSVYSLLYDQLVTYFILIEGKSVFKNSSSLVKVFDGVIINLEKELGLDIVSIIEFMYLLKLVVGYINHSVNDLPEEVESAINYLYILEVEFYNSGVDYILVESLVNYFSNSGVSGLVSVITGCYSCYSYNESSISYGVFSSFEFGLFVHSGLVEDFSKVGFVVSKLGYVVSGNDKFYTNVFFSMEDISVSSIILLDPMMMSNQYCDIYTLHMGGVFLSFINLSGISVIDLNSITSSIYSVFISQGNIHNELDGSLYFVDYNSKVCIYGGSYLGAQHICYPGGLVPLFPYLITNHETGISSEDEEISLASEDLDIQLVKDFPEAISRKPGIESTELYVGQGLGLSGLFVLASNTKYTMFSGVEENFSSVYVNSLDFIYIGVGFSYYFSYHVCVKKCVLSDRFVVDGSNYGVAYFVGQYSLNVCNCCSEESSWVVPSESCCNINNKTCYLTSHGDVQKIIYPYIFPPLPVMLNESNFSVSKSEKGYWELSPCESGVDELTYVQVLQQFDSNYYNFSASFPGLVNEMEHLLGGKENLSCLFSYNPSGFIFLEKLYNVGNSYNFRKTLIDSDSLVTTFESDESTFVHRSENGLNNLPWGVMDLYQEEFDNMYNMVWDSFEDPEITFESETRLASASSSSGLNELYTINVFVAALEQMFSYIGFGRMGHPGVKLIGSKFWVSPLSCDFIIFPNISNVNLIAPNNGPEAYSEAGLEYLLNSHNIPPMSSTLCTQENLLSYTCQSSGLMSVKVLLEDSVLNTNVESKIEESEMSEKSSIDGKKQITNGSPLEVIKWLDQAYARIKKNQKLFFFPHLDDLYDYFNEKSEAQKEELEAAVSESISKVNEMNMMNNNIKGEGEEDNS